MTQSLDPNQIPQITISPEGKRFAGKLAPLDFVIFEAQDATEIQVRDGAGGLYAENAGDRLECRVSGALGIHQAVAHDDAGHEIGRAAFEVRCTTNIQDTEGDYQRLLEYCKLTMFGDFYRPENVKRLDHRMIRGYVLTSRDHVHGIKGMKYFHSVLPEWMDAFADHQADDGMIWDFCKLREGRLSHFENRWGEKFSKVTEDGLVVFARQPMMNDVEHMFVQGIYLTWRNTGDDDWMRRRLDHAIRAVRYATSSPYTWSEKLGLIRRTFTIDMWDFQSDFDAALVGGDAMQAIPGVSEYGAMYGDTHGIAMGCDWIAEMLEAADRADEAPEFRELAETLRGRLNELSWNGKHFKLFVPENPEFERPFGVDPDTQVTLSNAYALSRNITHEQAVAIIKTYLRIKEETRDFAPAEWFCCYPPFPRGFGAHGMWHYVNGGVSPMVAGELARGAFEHGFEPYGADIIDRVLKLADQYNGIPKVWRGRVPEEIEANFTPLNLREVANTDFSSESRHPETRNWMGEGTNDLRSFPVDQEKFAQIPFDIIDPAENEGRACLVISESAGLPREVELPVSRKAGSLYFLHVMQGKEQVAGDYTLRYADGSEHRQMILRGPHIGGWWMPSTNDDSVSTPHISSDPKALVGWRGSNPHCKDIGVIVATFDNPEPDKEIRSIVLTASRAPAAQWAILGLTLSDQPAQLPAGGISTGIPAPWSVGAMVYALIEGQAGIQELSAGWRSVRIAPRWAAGHKNAVQATALVEDCGGYVSYDWRLEHNSLRLDFTANTATRQVELLLPSGAHPLEVRLNGNPAHFEVLTIEESRYIKLHTNTLSVQRLEVSFHRAG